LQPGEKVLEIGFGTSHCQVALAHAVGPNGKVYGIHIADAMRRHAEETLQTARLPDRADLTCGDGQHLSYPAEPVCTLAILCGESTLEKREEAHRQG
jgi:demethylmenaquinone methyltransferase/2-methoxy-6-polyprenyl-1,4-benzoquinol methylase